MSKSFLKRRLLETDEDSAGFVRDLQQVNPEKIQSVLNEQLPFDPASKAWKIIEYTDYTGGATERANASYFLKNYPGVVQAVSNPRFNSVVVGIPESAVTKMTTEMAASLLEDLKNLNTSGLLSEEEYRSVEAEKRNEAWNHRFRSEFVAELKRRFPQIDEEYIEDERLRSLFEDARDMAGVEWTEENGAEQTVDVIEAVSAVTPELIRDWLFPNQGEIDTQIESLLEHRKFSCVTARAPEELADLVRGWGQMFITDDKLYIDPQDPEGFGREADPHVTVKFGLHEKEPSPELLKVIEETQPFEIGVGAASLFENEQYDVVKFDIDSEPLHALNARLSDLQNSDEHPDYHPHMTVAYVTKGTCRELIGKPLADPEQPTALRFLVNSLVFSSPSKTKIRLFLGKPNLEPEKINEADEFSDDGVEANLAKYVHGLNVKEFTDADVDPHGTIPGAGRIIADHSDLVQVPTAWQKQGLQQTASGYGAKLNTGMMIHFNGKLYRLYATQYGNAGSVWFVAKGRKIFVS